MALSREEILALAAQLNSEDTNSGSVLPTGSVKTTQNIPTNSTQHVEAETTGAAASVNEADDIKLEQIFGPVVESMSRPEDRIESQLVDVFYSTDDTTGQENNKYVILKVVYHPAIPGLNLKNTPTQTALVHLNTQTLKDPNSDDRVYVDNEERKQYIDNLVAYAFKDYGITKFEEVYPKFQQMLAAKQEVKVNIWQYIFKTTGQNGSDVFRSSFRLINRMRQTNFIETSFVGEDLWKKAVIQPGSVLPVKVLRVRDNLAEYEKDGRVFKFARWEVYVNDPSDGKNYMIKYNYLRQDDNGNDFVDYQRRIVYASEIARYLGLTGSINEIIEKKFPTIDNQQITVNMTVNKSNVTYRNGAHKGEVVYYAKLA